MKLTEELDKLVTLRDRGDITFEEYDKAKTIVLTGKQAEEPDQTSVNKVTVIQKLTSFDWWMVIGSFAGNFLYNVIFKSDATRGFWVGILSATLVLLMTLAVKSFSSNKP